MNGQTGPFLHLSFIEREGFLIMHSDKCQFYWNTWTRPSCATWPISFITPTNTPPLGTLERQTRTYTMSYSHKYAGNFYTKLGPAMKHNLPIRRASPPPEPVPMRMSPLWIPSPYPGGDFQLRYTPFADFFSKSNTYIRLSLPMPKPTINDSYSEPKGDLRTKSYGTTQPGATSIC